MDHERTSEIVPETEAEGVTKIGMPRLKRLADIKNYLRQLK
jgi:hypothetical protein